MQAKILVVDDDPGPRESLRIILKKNHIVRTAASGEEALEQIERDKPDLVFLDLRMAGMDGTEVLRRIKERYSDVEVAIITAYAGLDSARLAVRYGALDYLIKPYSVADVERIVDSALSIRRRQRDAEVLTMQLARTTELLVAQMQSLQELQQGDAKARRDVEETVDRLRSVQDSLADGAGSVRELTELGEAAAEVIHDINNLLTIILVNSEHVLAELGPAGSGDQASISSRVERILRAASDCSMMSRRIKDFVRSRTSCQPTQVDVNDVVLHVVDLRRQARSAEGDEAEILAHLGDVPLIYGEELALRTALFNLVENSLEAIRSQQWSGVRHYIEISTACEVDPTTQEQQVLIRVRDNGPGMAPEVLAKATRPFFSTKPAHGTGLGLSIVDRVVKQHGGRLQIESAPGRGTTVTMQLPVLPAFPPETDLFVWGQARSGGTVILVDDSPEIREVMASLLESAGYQVVRCAAGAEGWAFLQRTYQHGGDSRVMVIADQEMPGMKGRELAAHVKDLDPRIPVLIVSGYACDGDGPEDAMLPKPFDVRVFLRQVRELMANNDQVAAR